MSNITLLTPSRHSFRINDDYCFIFVHELAIKASTSHLKEVNFSDIEYAGSEYYPQQSGFDCECCGGIKYINANIYFPGLLVEGLSEKSKYKLIDGRHRLDKMRINGMTKSKFYVFDYSEVEELIYHCNTEDEKDEIYNKVAMECMHLRDTQERL